MLGLILLSNTLGMKIDWEHKIAGILFKIWIYLLMIAIIVIIAKLIMIMFEAFFLK